MSQSLYRRAFKCFCGELYFFARQLEVHKELTHSLHNPSQPKIGFLCLKVECDFFAESEVEMIDHLSVYHFKPHTKKKPSLRSVTELPRAKMTPDEQREWSNYLRWELGIGKPKPLSADEIKKFKEGKG